MSGEPPGAIRAVTVYCSASNRVHEAYLALARSVGELIARSGRSVVSGGGKVGLMGELAMGCRSAGGLVTGIITRRLKDAEQLDEANHENLVVGTMRERKALLESRGDAMLILPGGLGTMEEFFEILTGRLLGEHDKPIVIVNPLDPDGRGHFYDPLLLMIRHMVELKFAKPGIFTLFEVVHDEPAAIAALDRLEHEGSRGPVDRSHLIPSTPM